MRNPPSQEQGEPPEEALPDPFAAEESPAASVPANDNDAVNQATNSKIADFPAPGIEESSTITTHKNSSTEPATDMEVHPHSHAHGSKTWKNYAWEFIMLFLAVFCGFLAEWQLEHVVEHSREKSYVQSLVGDVKIDTRNIDSLTSHYKNILSHLDSLSRQLVSPELAKDSYPAYMNWRKSYWFPDFVPNDGTIQQLIGSGGLRLITQRKVVDAIMVYQREIEAVKIHQAVMNTLLATDRRQYELFDALTIQQSSSMVNIPLLTGDKKILSWACGQTQDWTQLIRQLNVRVLATQRKGRELLGIVQSQYGIE